MRRGIKALVAGGASAIALLTGMAPASAAPGAGQGLRGCEAQLEHSGELRSPTCSVEGGFHPPAGGIEANHNEALVREVGWPGQRTREAS